MNNSAELGWDVKTKVPASKARFIDASSGTKFSSHNLDPGGSGAVNLILFYHAVDISN